ncbi:hypothetical protein [Bradyrhizobium symbiodeficiens]|uniref:hypothetical protein n=1 Tax=Bradyrhizobium symbiodeficiens TaxID=1404367 RepID=UPI00140FC2C3|nr:hypothetical protein [Bradyrhizobium symbiodeficiens]QIP02989.1 hypothetical protein HAU86_25795 [Bradyrhizobium symbiodeficiens]
MANKKKGLKKTPPKPRPVSPMATPDMKWTLDLPERLRLAIADAVVIFSRIDNAIIECIWVLEQADYQRKLQIAKEKAYENIKFVKGVVEEHLKIDIAPTWNALDKMRQERNLIAHGCWMVRFGGDSPGEKANPPVGLPYVLWHSKMLENSTDVAAEAFDYWKFKRFMDHAEVLLRTFREFRDMAERAIADERVARAAGTG